MNIELLDRFRRKTPAVQQRNKLVEILTPSYIHRKAFHVEIDSVLHKVLIAAGYPRRVRDGWLDKLTGAKGSIDASIHITPVAQDEVVRILDDDKRKLLRNIAEDEAKGFIIPDSVQIRLDDTLGMIRAIEQGDTKAYDMSLYLDVREDDPKQLTISTKYAEAVMNQMRILHKQATRRHDEGLIAILPLCEDTIKVTQMVPTQILAACYPFTTYNISTDNISGVLYGYNLKNDLPVIVDRRKLMNQNALVIATSGSGKSYFEKITLMREYETGTHISIVDPQSEYTDLAEKYNGQLVTLGTESKSSINLFDIGGTTLFDKLLQLQSYYQLIFGELSDPQRVMLDKATREIYESCDIRLKEPKTWKKESHEMPILYDLLNVLKSYESEGSIARRSVAEALSSRLDMYVEGPLQFMNRRTNVTLEGKRMVVFNFHKMPALIVPLASFIVSSYIMSRLSDVTTRKRLVIDEAGAMIRYPMIASQIFDMATQGRKFNLGLDILIQDPVFLGEVKDAVLSNTSVVVLLPHTPQKVDTTASLFKLNKKERNVITSARDIEGKIQNRGKGIIIIDGAKIPFRIRASPKAHEIITTDPAEKKLKEKERRKEGENGRYTT